jgi:hypothetical protein
MQRIVFTWRFISDLLGAKTSSVVPPAKNVRRRVEVAGAQFVETAIAEASAQHASVVATGEIHYRSGAGQYQFDQIPSSHLHIDPFGAFGCLQIQAFHRSPLCLDVRHARVAIHHPAHGPEGPLPGPRDPLPNELSRRQQPGATRSHPAQSLGVKQFVEMTALVTTRLETEFDAVEYLPDNGDARYPVDARKDLCSVRTNEVGAIRRSESHDRHV